MRDQLYPVKVDNVNRMAVLDHDGKVLLGAAEVLGEENEAQNWVAQQDISQFFMGVQRRSTREGYINRGGIVANHDILS